jgi:glycosyltransferase involved in cell wall biosynthesis
MTARRTVALVVPALDDGMGVATVALFLRSVLAASGRYLPRVVSIATSSRDPQSVRLARPAGWLGRPRVERRCWRGVEYEHVGAFLAEVEFQRYRPRPELQRLLAGCDLVQVVAGAPAWACAALGAGPPVVLQTATLVAVERRMQARADRGPVRRWRALMTRVTTRMEEAAVRSVDAVFVENRWMHDRLSRLRDGGVHFAPPGVDTRFFTPAAYAHGGYLLAVGRFSDPRKDVRTLLGAYARLCAARPSAPDLVLVGKSPGAAELDYLRSLPVAGRVRVVTDVSADELAAWYRGASAFVLSSAEEGLGMVILEAMASGLPVVSTDCGGPATSVVPGETGLLTPVGDPAALAHALARVLDDPVAARRMGEAGRARAEREFALEVAGERFLGVYDALLDH